MVKMFAIHLKVDKDLLKKDRFKDVVEIFSGFKTLFQEDNLNRRQFYGKYLVFDAVYLSFSLFIIEWNVLSK